MLVQHTYVTSSGTIVGTVVAKSLETPTKKFFFLFFSKLMRVFFHKTAHIYAVLHGESTGMDFEKF